jgi:outer membrane protein assembly factor BamB
MLTSSVLTRVRWWVLGFILLIGVGLIGFVRTTSPIDYAFRNPFIFLATVFTLVLVSLWFLIFSGLRWRTRISTLAGAAATIAVVGAAVRVDGVYGEMIPQFRWRWAPARDYDLAKVDIPSLAAERIDLRHTSPRDFCQFLGPKGRGVLEGVPLARDWSKQPPRLVWRQPIGAGWSAFSVVGDYAITQEQRGDAELVTCYELLTGKSRWVHEDQVRFSEVMGGDGPRATPTIVDGRVYAMGATGILNCLDGATGKVLWSHDTLAEHGQKNLPWGKSCSPLVFEDVVVVTLGDANDPSLVAYTGDAGRPLWHAGHDKASYASPVLATPAEREQILVVNQASVSAHDPAYGDLLWEYPWPGEYAKCSQPLPLSDDRIFISAGYGIGCALLEVKSADGVLSVNERWKKLHMKTRFTNVVATKDHIYGLDDGILACLELATGQLKWKGGRYGHGQVLLVDDVLLVMTEDGEVVLVQADPSGHRELTRHKALTGKTWNNPALAGRYLLVRNSQEAACFELPIENTATSWHPRGDSHSNKL